MWCPFSDLVVSQLQKSQSTEETDTDFESTLAEVIAKVKDITMTTKKSVQSATATDE